MAHLVYREIIQCTPRDLCLTIRSARRTIMTRQRYIETFLEIETFFYPRKILYNGIMKKKKKKRIFRRFTSRGDLYNLPHDSIA